MPGTDDTITLAEAARRLGIHRTTLDRWIQDGKVSYVQIGSIRRVRVSVINGLAREVPATDPPGADQ